jgi:hypothetical protein
MSVLTSFLKAAAEVARDSDARNRNRSSLLKPFMETLAVQGIRDTVSDLNTLLSSVKAPLISDRVSEEISDRVSAFIINSIDTSQKLSSSTAQFLDRLNRACSEEQ